MTTMIHVEDLSKTFVLHLQAGTHIPVLNNLAFDVKAGECVALHGPSGAGKSTLLRSLYGNYLPDGGKVMVCHRDTMVDLVTAEPRDILEIRRETVGYVSQFLRAIPRVSSLDIVAEPARSLGQSPDSRAGGTRARSAPSSQRSRGAARAGARDIFRRRTAAYQYCPGIRGRLSDPASGRTNGIAGCGQQGRRSRPDPRSSRSRRRDRRHLS